MKRAWLMSLCGLAAVCLAAPAALAQGRMGVVNVQMCFDKSYYGRKLQKQLQDQKRRIEYDVKRRGEAIEARRRQLIARSQSSLTRPEAALAQQRAFRRQVAEFEDLRRRYVEDYRMAVAKAKNDMLKKILQIVTSLGQQGRYTLVIPRRMVLYMTGNVDLTGQVIAALNQKYR
ncbi:MAG: OmpH family outer membrane protein [Proteobacteria bacterium]|nr:OmpH family outer membrane protein [Pseudomonadota bacterium]